MNFYISTYRSFANHIALPFVHTSWWRRALLIVAATLPLAAHAEIDLAVVATSGAVDGQSVADSAARGNTEKYAKPLPGDLVRFCPNASCDWGPTMVWRKFGSLGPTDKIDVCLTDIPAGTVVPRPWTRESDACKSWAAVAKSVAYPGMKLAVVATSGAADGQSVADSAARGNTEKYAKPLPGDLVRFCPNASCDWGPTMVWRKFGSLGPTDKIDVCLTDIPAGTVVPRPWTRESDACKSWAAVAKSVAYPEVKLAVVATSGAVDGQSVADSAARGNTEKYAKPLPGDLVRFCPNASCDWGPTMVWRKFGSLGPTDKIDVCLTDIPDGTVVPRPWTRESDACKSWAAVAKSELQVGSGQNSAPSISGVPATSVIAKQSYTFQPSAADANGDALTFSIANRPSWAAFNAATGQLKGTPDTANVATYANILISVSDGKVSSSLPAFTITVKAVANRAPAIGGSPATSVIAGSAFNFQPTASDADGDKLSYTILNRPSWTVFNSATGALTGTPASAAIGTYANIVISVSDGKVTTSLPAFTIVVKPVPNRAPTISGSPATSVSAGSAYGFQPSASDPDGDVLGFSIQNRPVWAIFSTATGALSGTPTNAQAGTYANIVITVSDGKTTAALPALSINVTAANTAPTISGSPVKTASVDGAYKFRPTASDADGDTLTFSVTNLPAWARFDVASGELSGTPSAADIGSYDNVIVSVSDGKATASMPAFAILVSQVTLGSAKLSWSRPTQNTDGSTLNDLAGYRIVYGTNATALNQTISIANAGTTTYVVSGLSPATYYFALKAYNSAGVESGISQVVSKDLAPALNSLAIACDKPGQRSGTPVNDCGGFEVYRKPMPTDLVRSCLDGQPESCWGDANYSHRRLDEIADATFVEVCDTQIPNGSAVPYPWSTSADLCKSWRVIPKWQLLLQ